VSLLNIIPLTFILFTFWCFRHSLSFVAYSDIASIIIIIYICFSMFLVRPAVSEVLGLEGSMKDGEFCILLFYSFFLIFCMVRG